MILTALFKIMFKLCDIKPLNPKLKNNNKTKREKTGSMICGSAFR